MVYFQSFGKITEGFGGGAIITSAWIPAFAGMTLENIPIKIDHLRYNCRVKKGLTIEPVTTYLTNCSMEI
jgi:hypothetical protein